MFRNIGLIACGSGILAIAKISPVTWWSKVVAFCGVGLLTIGVFMAVAGFIHLVLHRSPEPSQFCSAEVGQS